MIELKPEDIRVANVLLDPNNPRFFDLEDWGEPYSQEMYSG